MVVEVDTSFAEAVDMPRRRDEWRIAGVDLVPTYCWYASAIAWRRTVALIFLDNSDRAVRVAVKLVAVFREALCERGRSAS